MPAVPGTLRPPTFLTATISGRVSSVFLMVDIGRVEFGLRRARRGRGAVRRDNVVWELLLLFWLLGTRDSGAGFAARREVEDSVVDADPARGGGGRMDAIRGTE